MKKITLSNQIDCIHFTVNFANELANLLASLEDGTEVNISYVTFGARCASVIQKEMDRLVFVTEEEPLRTELKTYYEDKAKAKPIDLFQHIPLDCKSYEDVFEFASKIPRDSYVHFDIAITNPMNYAFIVALMSKRPDITIDATGYASALLAFIAGTWDEDVVDCSKAIIVSHNRMSIIDTPGVTSTEQNSWMAHSGAVPASLLNVDIFDTTTVGWQNLKLKVLSTFLPRETETEINTIKNLVMEGNT